MSDYEVGHGRPPKQHRWTKGVSGNPKGRPRKTIVKPQMPPDLRTLILEEASRPVRVVENGLEVELTIVQAVVKRLCLQAMKGERKAVSTFFEQIQAARDKADSECGRSCTVDAVDTVTVEQAAKAYFDMINVVKFR